MVIVFNYINYLIWLIPWVLAAQGELAKYEFYRYHGQVFLDLSGADRHALNGEDLAYNQGEDMLNIDNRGIYGDGQGNCYVRTPAHNEIFEDLALTPAFTATFLVKVMGTGLIYGKRIPGGADPNTSTYLAVEIKDDDPENPSLDIHVELQTSSGTQTRQWMNSPLMTQQWMILRLRTTITDSGGTSVSLQVDDENKNLGEINGTFYDSWGADSKGVPGYFGSITNKDPFHGFIAVAEFYDASYTGVPTMTKPSLSEWLVNYMADNCETQCISVAGSVVSYGCFQTSSTDPGQTSDPCGQLEYWVNAINNPELVSCYRFANKDVDWVKTAQCDNQGDCLVCSSSAPSVCIVCRDETDTIQNGICQNGCADGTYFDGVSWVNCHSHWTTCMYNGPTSCTSCPSGAFLENPQSETSACRCLDGQGIWNGTCNNWDQICKQCTSSEIFSCTECYEGAYMFEPDLQDDIYQGICYWYHDNQPYTTPDACVLDSCDQSADPGRCQVWAGWEWNGTCAIITCHEYSSYTDCEAWHGWMWNFNSGWQQCDLSCKNCFSADQPSNWTECFENATLLSTGPSSYWNCNSGYTWVPQNCIVSTDSSSWNPKCETCVSDNHNECETCRAGSTPDSGAWHWNEGTAWGEEVEGQVAWESCHPNCRTWDCPQNEYCCTGCWENAEPHPNNDGRWACSYGADRLNVDPIGCPASSDSSTVCDDSWLSCNELGVCTCDASAYHNGQDGCDCNEGYYMSAAVWVQWGYLCLACSQGGDNQCEDCKEGAIQEQDKTPFSCRWDDGYDYDPGSQSCIQCGENQSYVNHSWVCSVGYVYVNSSNSWISCNSSCENCLVTYSSSCSSWVANASMITYGWECNEGFEVHADSNSCISLWNPICDTCVEGSYDECETCATGTTKNGTTWDCNEGTARQENGVEWQACDASCITCSGPHCIYCCTSCREGTLGNGEYAGSWVCEFGPADTLYSASCPAPAACSSPWATCYDGTCTDCGDNAYSDSPGTCACNQGYYLSSGGQWEKCGKLCLYCTQGGDEQWDQCVPDAGKYSDVGPGLCSCDASYTHNQATNSCDRCGANQTWNQDVGQCECSYGYFGPLPCQQCKYLCADCVGDNQECGSENCVANATAQNDNTWACDQGYEADPVSNVCIGSSGCSNNCVTCSWNDATIWFSCEENASLVNGNWVCDLYFARDGNIAPWSRCHDNCRTCENPGDISRCTSCHDNAKLEQADNIGIDKWVCTYVEGDDKYDAVSCPADPNANSACLQAWAVCNDQFCSECSENATWWPAGICECITGYYLGSSGNCEQCGERCASCTNGGNAQCYTWIANASQSVAPGECSWNSGFVWMGSSSACESCPTLWTTCEADQFQAWITWVDNATVFFDVTYNRWECDSTFTYAASTNECLECGNLWDSCDQDSGDVCLICVSNATHETENQTCSWNEGWYQESRTEWIKCHESCSSCVGPAENCTWCNDSNSERNLTNDQCVCKDGFARDASGCQPCNGTLCQTCDQLGADYCTSWVPSATIVYDTFQNLTCSWDANKQEIDGVCEWVCWPTWATCNGPNEQQCLSCSSGKFLEEASQRCLDWDISCQECEGQGPNLCTLCNADAQFNQAMGSCDCLTGTFRQEEVAQCSQCQQACAAWTASACQTCIANASLISNIEWACHPGYAYEGNQWVACHSTCATWSQTNSAQCLTCKQGHFFSEGNWTPCHNTCKECNGAADNNCTSCESDHYLNNNSCTPNTSHTCDDGEGIVGGQCQEWDSQCRHCETVVSHWTSCFDHAYIHEGATGCRCVDGYAPHADQGVRYCQPCHDTWKTCLEPSDSDKCQTCFGTATVFGSTGTCTCGDGSWYDVANEICGACFATWASWETGAENDCISWVPDTNDNATNGTWTWDEGLGWNGSSCVQWHEDCGSCNGTTINACLTCWSNAELMSVGDSGGHYCECKDGWYPNPSHKYCSPCSGHCKNCTDEYSTSCTSCYPYAEISGGSATGEWICITGFVYNGSEWLSTTCHNTCLTCVGDEANECFSWRSNASLKAEGTCECNDNYVFSPDLITCVICYNELCKSWDIDDLNLCTDWYDNASDDAGMCVWDSGFFQQGIACLAWADAWQSCSSFTECSDWIVNAGFVLENRWDCNPQYVLVDNICSPWADACLTCTSQLTTDCSEWVENASFDSDQTWGCLPQYVLVNNACSPCYQTCEVCVGTESNECQSWGNGAVLSNGECGCADDYYMENRNCWQCHTCVTCERTGTDTYNWLNCIANASLQVNGQGHVRWVCNPGYVLVNNFCTACPTMCEICTASVTATTCTKCFGSANGTPWICPEHFVTNTDETGCDECTAPCKACQANYNLHVCTSWYDNAALVDSDCVWNDGYFQDLQQDSSCSPCGGTCSTCTSLTDCIECKDGFFCMENSLTTCVSFCPDSTWEDSYTYTCRTCHASCESCNGSLVTDWVTCADDNAELVDNVWVCQSNMYDSNDDADLLGCRGCDDACQEWNGPSDTDCLGCKTGFYAQLDSVNTCRDLCPPRQYPDESSQSCVACHEDWATCINASRAACTNCSNTEAILNQENVGACICPVGQFDAGTDALVCYACHTLCESCNGSLATEWIKCADSAAIIVDNVWVCPSQMYDNNDDADLLGCRGCNDACQEWNGPTDSDCTECKTGFWLQPDSVDTCRGDCPTGCYPQESTKSCVVCHADWATCSDAGNAACTSCSNNEATLILGECVCPDGQFDAGTDTLNCQVCHVDCATCVGAGSEQCTTCAVANTDVTSNPGSCSCNDTFFPTRSDPIACSAWHTTCKTCSAAEEGNCLSCHSNSELSDGRCACSQGSYTLRDSNNWLQCDASCSTWENADACITCAETAYRLSSGLWAFWEDKFYYNSSQGACAECQPYCSTCSETSSWITCEDETKSFSVGYCCGTKQYRNVQGQCHPCGDTCAECSDATTCTSCVENAVFDQTTCVCSTGYHQFEGSCHVDASGPILTFNEIQPTEIELSWDKAIAQVLDTSNTLLKIAGVDEQYYSYQMNEIETAKVYRVNFEFDDKSIPENSKYDIEFLTEITDLDGNPASRVQISGAITAANEQRIDPVQEEEKEEELERSEVPLTENEESVQSGTSTTTTAAVTSGLATGFITGDLTTTWVFVNTVQILAHIPLMDSKNVPPLLVNTLKGLLDFEIIPNVFESVVPESEFSDQEPYDIAKDFGYDNNVFLINCGGMLCNAFSLLLALPLLLLFSACPNTKIADWSKQQVAGYRWNFFLRVWIELHLEVGIAAYFQFTTPRYGSAVETINTLLGYVFYAITFISFPLTLFFLFKNRQKILSREETFWKKYGTVVNEFKNDRGSMSSMFYAWFFLRRTIYILTIILLRNYVGAQLIINLVHTLISLLFLLKYMPYTGRLTNYVSLYSEFVTAAIFGLVACYHLEIEGDMVDQLQWSAIALLFSVVFINLALSLITSLIAIKEYCSRRKSRNGPQKNITKISNLDHTSVNFEDKSESTLPNIDTQPVPSEPDVKPQELISRAAVPRDIARRASERLKAASNYTLPYANFASESVSKPMALRSKRNANK